MYIDTDLGSENDKLCREEGCGTGMSQSGKEPRMRESSTCRAGFET